MRAVLVISIALAIGCRDESLARLESIRDEVCACETVACGEDAMNRIPQDKVEATPRSQKVARAMLDCLSKLYTGERPDPGPDGETGGGAGAQTGTGETGAETGAEGRADTGGDAVGEPATEENQRPKR